MLLLPRGGTERIFLLKRNIGEISFDLSKAFNCSNHDLRIANFADFQKNDLKYILLFHQPKVFRQKCT